MSKKALYVYSTLAAPMIYTKSAPGGADLPVTVAEVHIAGGTGIPDKRLVTPRGVVTKITAEQAEVLRGNDVFKLHEKNGYVLISEAEEDPESVASEMAERDPSAPLEPGDYIREAAAQENQPDVAVPADVKATNKRKA